MGSVPTGGRSPLPAGTALKDSMKRTGHTAAVVLVVSRLVPTGVLSAVQNPAPLFFCIARSYSSPNKRFPLRFRFFFSCHLSSPEVRANDILCAALSTAALASLAARVHVLFVACGTAVSAQPCCTVGQRRPMAQVDLLEFEASPCTSISTKMRCSRFRFPSTRPPPLSAFCHPSVTRSAS